MGCGATEVVVVVVGGRAVVMVVAGEVVVGGAAVDEGVVVSGEVAVGVSVVDAGPVVGLAVDPSGVDDTPSDEPQPNAVTTHTVTVSTGRSRWVFMQ